MPTYKIPQANIEELKAQVAKLNKAAAKVGAEPIRCEIFERIEQVFTDDLYGTRRVKVFFMVEVEGSAPKYAGWTLGATLQHTEAGVVVRSVPGLSIPASYQAADKWCDHCQSRRFRKDTFVVLHEDGSTKQIGRNCLRDFLGHQNPEQLAAFAEHIFELDGSMSEFESDHGVRGEDAIFTIDILTLAAAAVRQFGWVSRSYAQQSGAIATASRVADHVYTRPSEKTYPESRIECVDADKVTADEAQDYVFANLQGAQGEYEHNLFVTCSRESLGRRDFGLACSVISFVAKRLERDVIKPEEQELKSNEFLGAVGDRIGPVLMTLVDAKTVGRQAYSYYDEGVSYLYKFETATGALASWFSSRELEVSKGFAYRVTGTIKKLDSYNGRNTTNLTRCKVLA